jgi:hypothetical protein
MLDNLQNMDFSRNSLNICYVDNFGLFEYLDCHFCLSENMHCYFDLAECALSNSLSEDVLPDLPFVGFKFEFYL